MTTAERFWSKVDRTEGCWLWRGATLDSGYGHVSLSGTSTTAHRFAYELLVGPIPLVMQLDHLCRIRNCVNPDHLSSVGNAVPPVKRTAAARAAWPDESDAA